MPQPDPFTSSSVAALDDTLSALVAAGGSPGGVIICGTRDRKQREVITCGTGGTECGPALPGEDTMYDIASLTKVTSTWPLTGQALAAGLIELDAPIRTYLPAFDGPAPSGQATIRQILTHTSGLRAATRLDLYRGNPAPLHELICREPLDEPPGRHRYINRGFILLGLALAHITGTPLHDLAAALWTSAGMTSTRYGPVSRASHVAPTEQVLPGAPRLQGSVHDGNAALMGGIAGHAGVFSTPSDLAAYATYLLGTPPPLAAWTRDSFTPHTKAGPGIWRGLAWLTAPGAIFHHGFTGTSLYLVPERGRYIVICTNAIYHGPAGQRLRPLRDAALTMTGT